MAALAQFKRGVSQMNLWYLQWRSSLSKERHREIPLAKNFLTIGRSPDNDLQLDDPSISRVHAILRKVSEGVMVEDADSVNGIVVGGKPQSQALIAAGDSFELGNFSFTIVRHSMNQPTVQQKIEMPKASEEKISDTLEDLQPLEAEVEGPHLLELKKDGSIERVLPLTGETKSVGRSKNCDFQMADRRISRHHADLICDRGDWRVVDRSSGNGITLQKGKVQELQLFHGMRFCLGTTWFVYSEADTSEAETLINEIPAWDEDTNAERSLTNDEIALATQQIDLDDPESLDLEEPATRQVDLAAVAEAVVASSANETLQTPTTEPFAAHETAQEKTSEQISAEEFLKEGEPCHACGKKLDEGALFCGHCGAPTPTGVATHLKRRESGFGLLLLAWLCLGGGLIFWAWGFPGASTLSQSMGLSINATILSAVGLLAFVYHAAVLGALARQTDIRTYGIEWVPILNVLAFTKVAHLRPLWAFALLIPGPNLLVYVYIWWRIAYYRRKPRWFGLFTLIPIFNFFIPLYLAHETEEQDDATEHSICQKCGRLAKRNDRFCGVCGYPRP
jgi:pSer/pThr/pTyr-binding forkhead associated (FHA) protein